MTRESLVIDTLVDLADTLVDDYDVIDVLTNLCRNCVAVLDVDAAGVLLASPEAALQFVASSSESMRFLELLQLQTEEGPCIDCFRIGYPIVNHSLKDLLKDLDTRWPLFTPRALEFGFVSVHCLPMRLRSHTLGALNFFRTQQGPLNPTDVNLAQSLADVATIALVQNRAANHATKLNTPLRVALDSRIVIEQAKGMVCQASNVDMDEAFLRIRHYARRNNLWLTTVATSIVAGTLTSGTLQSEAKKRPSSR